MKSIAIAAALSLAAGAAVAADGPARTGSAELEALVAKTTDGLAVANLPASSGAPAIAARREQTGEVEVHDGFNDIFAAHSGRATVLVGGQVAGNRQTAPGEWRGGKITGAQSYEMGPGDLLWIPAGLPHLVVVPKGGAFTYVAFKSPK